MAGAKQHRYVSLVGPAGLTGATALLLADALSAAENEGWPPVRRAQRKPARKPRAPALALDVAMQRD